MAKFRKKPIVIEAEQWGFIESQEFAEIACRGLGDCAYSGGEETEPHIHTLEGCMVIGPLDWIIKGVNGEFYPIKPDIFEKTYERVED